MLDIVVFTARDWAEYQRRPHYTALARYARVLVVELPLTPFSLLKRRRGKEFGLRKIDDNLYVFTPFALLPYGLAFRSELLMKINACFIAANVQTILRKLDFINYVQIIFQPYQAGLQQVLSPSIRCLEIVDEYTTLTGPNTDMDSWEDRRLAELEKRMASEVDIVFAASRSLYEKKRKLNQNIYYLPNGADYEHFAKAQNKDGKLPIEIGPLPAPRIGFVGNLTDFVDFKLLISIAKNRPQWSLIALGEDNTTPKMRDTKEYQTFMGTKNIHWLGRKEYEDLPDYLRGMDAVIMPYQTCDRMRYSEPNKIYQYLASGKPIVSTAFPSVKEHKSVMGIANNQEEFLDLLEKALAVAGNAGYDQRISIAQANSLNKRAKKQIEYFSNILGRRK